MASDLFSHAIINESPLSFCVAEGGCGLRSEKKSTHRIVSDTNYLKLNAVSIRYI